MRQWVIILSLAYLIGLPTYSKAQAQQCEPIITTVAGTGQMGFSGDGGPAISAMLWHPYGVTINNNNQGNIYIADTENNRVRKVDLNGIITTVAGNGQQGFAGDGGFAIYAKLNEPREIVTDSQGNFYIADWFNKRVRKIDPNGIITTIAGNGYSGFSGDNGLAINAKISPYGIALDGQGNIYIADSFFNNRIRKITTSGIITTVAGNGQVGFFGDRGPAVNAMLGYPRGVVVDNQGNIYISDTDNNRIRMVSAVDDQIRGYFQGNIYTLAGNGQAGFSGDGGVATNAQLDSPEGLAVDNQGNIYIADLGNRRVRKVDKRGIIQTVVGDGTVSTIGSAIGVAVDSAGGIYIADYSLDRIRKATVCSSHLACQNNQCVQIEGAGTDQCSNNTDCQPPPTHAECSKLACVQMPGAGPNMCSTNLHCRQCLDSDGGNKPAIGGMVITTRNRRFQKFQDQCIEINTAQVNLKYLTEYYCDNGKLKSQVHSCQKCSKTALSLGGSCTQ